MTIRRILWILCILLVTGNGVLFAGGRSENSSSETVTLTYVYWGSPAEDAAIKRALSAFEAAHPGIRVRPMYLPGDLDGSTYNARMTALAAAGNLPDVGYFRPEEFGNFANEGYFLQLDDLIARDELSDLFIPQTWLQIDGRTYGAYTAAENQVMWYNRTVLEDAGIPQPPTNHEEAWTWDEFVEYWKQITVDSRGRNPGDVGFDPDNIVRYGVSYDLWSAMYYPIVWSNGGEIISPDGRGVRIDEPEAMEAFQKLADLINVHHVMPYVAGGTNISPSTMLANEQLGFWVTGQWTLLELGAMEDLNLGVAALPILKQPAQIYLSGANVVFASTQHPEEAWELQKWMMNPEATLDLFTSGLWMPTAASYYSDPVDLARWVESGVHPEGYTEAVVDSMAIAVTEPIMIRNINQMWGDYLNPAIEQILLGIATAEEALPAAANRLRNSGLLQGTY